MWFCWALPLTVVKFLTWQPTEAQTGSREGWLFSFLILLLSFLSFYLAAMTVTSLALWRPALSSRSSVPFSSLSCIVLGRAHAVARCYAHERETVKGPELGSNQVLSQIKFSPSSCLSLLLKTGSYNRPGCPQTDLVAKASLELILLAPLPGFWNFRCVQPHSSFEVYPGVVHSPGNSLWV